MRALPSRALSTDVCPCVVDKCHRSSAGIVASRRGRRLEDGQGHRGFHIHLEQAVHLALRVKAGSAGWLCVNVCS
jgi:hypothetical protein